MNTIYKNTAGKVLSIVAEENGAPIPLASKTVTLNLYNFGTNLLVWTHACTVDDATNGLAHYTSVSTDFATVGDFYAQYVITGTGYARTFTYENFKVIENMESSVTPSALLEFMNIPASGAMPEATIQKYISMANTAINLLIPTLANVFNPPFVEMKLNLIMMKAATYYFLNMGENNVNPEVRLQKIATWNKEYKLLGDALSSALSDSSTVGQGAVRRVVHSSWTPYDIGGTA